MTVSNDLLRTGFVCYVNLAVRLFGMNTNNSLALYIRDRYYLWWDNAENSEMYDRVKIPLWVWENVRMVEKF